jgi:NADH-quinone oxidoreductase subunit K
VLEVGLNHFLMLSAVLFIIGLMGVLVRRNLIIIFMCVELMTNAVNLSLVAFGWSLDSIDGQAFALFIIAVAAAEAVVGLAIIIALSRRAKTIDVGQVSTLRD